MNPRLQARKWIFAAAPKPLVLHWLQSGCEFDDKVSFRHRRPKLGEIESNRLPRFYRSSFLKLRFGGVRKGMIKRKRDTILNERNC